MKYLRPAIEVEAMRVKDSGKFLVEFPNGEQIVMSEEEFVRDFRKANGNEILKRRKSPARTKVLPADVALPGEDANHAAPIAAAG